MNEASGPGLAAPATAAPGKFVAIWNPLSGKSGPEFRAAIERGFSRRGIECELQSTEDSRERGELAAAALGAGATHIVACGGDGTVMAVINGLLASGAAATDVSLCIIPGGTANLLATALNIPDGIDAAIDIAVNGADVAIDVGRCGDSYFALGIGLGLTGRMVAGTTAEIKERWGRLAYVWALLSEVGERPHRFSIRLDDGPERQHRGVAIVIANAGAISDKLRFAPDARMNDGLLDVCILNRFYWEDVFRMLARAVWGDVRRDRAVTFYQAKRVELRSQPPLDLQIDGEPMECRVPLIAEVLPGALKVRVPRVPNDEILALDV